MSTNYNFDSAGADNAINKIFNSSLSQQQNADDFNKAITELNNSFSGAIAEKFMTQAATHAKDLKNNAQNISEVGNTFESVKRKAIENAEKIGRIGGGQ